MGLFFEKRDSTKPFEIIKYLILTIGTFILIFSIINDFNLGILMFLFLLSAIGSIIDGIESYLKKENKNRILLDFGIALIWIVSFFVFL
jgi:hypothetical protein